MYVWPSVTLAHPTKAVGWNEMPFGRDTCVVWSNIILDRGLDSRGEEEIWGLKPPVCSDAAYCQITCHVTSAPSLSIFCSRLKSHLFLFLILISDALHFSLVQCLCSDFVISEKKLIVCLCVCVCVCGCLFDCIIFHLRFVHRQIRAIKAKMHQIQFLLGSAQTPLAELTVLPHTL